MHEKKQLCPALFCYVCKSPLGAIFSISSAQGIPNPCLVKKLCCAHSGQGLCLCQGIWLQSRLCAKLLPPSHPLCPTTGSRKGRQGQNRGPAGVVLVGIGESLGPLTSPVQLKQPHPEALQQVDINHKLSQLREEPINYPFKGNNCLTWLEVLLAEWIRTVKPLKVYSRWLWGSLELINKSWLDT